VSDIPKFFHKSPDYNKPVSLRVTQEQFDALGAAEKALELTKADILRQALDDWMLKWSKEIEAAIRKQKKGS
jgi:hypothetical protein